MTSEEARKRAEEFFKHEEREREGRAALSNYKARGRAVRENMARLRALRLGRQARPNGATGDQH